MNVEGYGVKAECFDFFEDVEPERGDWHSVYLHCQFDIFLRRGRGGNPQGV